MLFFLFEGKNPQNKILHFKDFKFQKLKGKIILHIENICTVLLNYNFVLLLSFFKCLCIKSIMNDNK